MERLAVAGDGAGGYNFSKLTGAMTMTEFHRLTQLLDGLSAQVRGPGGAIAVLKDGVPVVRQAWGWADVDRRIAFTPATLFRICSISKQFTCATMLERHPDPTVLNGDLPKHLPKLGARPSVLHLAHNQSGLRDYWATTVLCGAVPESVFGPDDARDLTARSAALQFASGTRYSYCNQNFRILGELVQDRAGTDLGLLMRRHVFDPAGMPSALLCPETSAMPDGTIGYEGSLEDGWRPAVNRLHWTGDAGIAASLDDMIAWEQAIDAARDDPASRYAIQSQPTNFADGTPAAYGFGLSHMMIHGKPAIGHGGGLRGWRSTRFYVPSERISVVVLFNHMADPGAVASDLLGALLDAPAPAAPPPANPDWAGNYRDDETGLLARVEITAAQRVRLWFGQGPDLLDPTEDGQASGGAVSLRADGAGLVMERRKENLRSTLVRCDGPASRDIDGTFHNAEYGSTFSCVSAGGVLYGAFAGVLGRGLMEPLLPAGPDLWRLPCPRALDFSAPGDWTLHFSPDRKNVTIGCWLARGIGFARV